MLLARSFPLQGGEAWSRVLPMAAFLFSGVCFREILMDINDRAGDGSAGLRTFPVVIGVEGALAVASVCMMCGIAVGASALATACAASTPGVASSARIAAAVLYVLSTIVNVGGDVVNILKSKFDHDVVSDVIDKSFGPIGRGMILLAVCL